MAFFPVWVYNNKTVCSPEPFRRKEKGKNALKFRFGKKDILTIPNLLSLFRILLIPQIVWLYAAAGRGYAASVAWRGFDPALGKLREAKALHDAIEGLVRPYMDFAALTDYTDRTLRELFV